MWTKKKYSQETLLVLVERAKVDWIDTSLKFYCLFVLTLSVTPCAHMFSSSMYCSACPGHLYSTDEKDWIVLCAVGASNESFNNWRSSWSTLCKRAIYIFIYCCYQPLVCVHHAYIDSRFQCSGRSMNESIPVCNSNSTT